MDLTVRQPMPDGLLVRARGGDAAAFAELVRAHQGSVFSIGYRMLNRRDAAEDLAQDVFLQLYRKLDHIESLEHLGFWLRRVAATLAIDWLRRSPANLAIDWLRRLPHMGTQPLEAGAEIAAPQREEDPFMSRELDKLL